VSSEPGALIELGNDALGAGDWRGARERFTAAVAVRDSGEARFGLAIAAAWLADMAGAITELERAYVLFRSRSDAWWSAAAALRLSLHYGEHLANPAAAGGWLARATRLVDEHGLDDLRGEVMLVRAGLASDRAAGEAAAREAVALGRHASTRDLELCALSQLGALLVEQGRVDEGIGLLDEAMAGCLGGEPASPETVAFSSCLTMRSCARCADFDRAVQWVRATDRFAQRYGSPFLQAECRTVYGMVLVATGEWTRAEEELAAAIQLSAGAVPAFHADAVAALADLRLAQGRIDEAERLLAGLHGYRSTVPVLARLQVQRGATELATATIRRGLASAADAVVGPPTGGGIGLAGAELAELLGAIEVGAGHYDAAAERGRTLVDAGRVVGCQMIVARGERLRGRALAGTDPAGSARHFDEAIALYLHLGMPFEVASTRLLLARAVRDVLPEVAVVEAGVALDALERLGAAGHADEAGALLRGLGVRPTRSGPRVPHGARGRDALTRREQEVFTLLGEGLSNPEIAVRLFLSRKTVEHHVASILSKLGVRNRAQAAAMAAAQRAGSPLPVEPAASRVRRRPDPAPDR
jgi:DNA-binding NarL/FixJ family response regulator/tetratricopeptide (TPR) repeat protein